jgi:YHS domain-containing protein
MVDENTAPSMDYKGKMYYFMKPEHREMFKKDPDKFLNRGTENSGHMNM